MFRWHVHSDISRCACISSAKCADFFSRLLILVIVICMDSVVLLLFCDLLF